MGLADPPVLPMPDNAHPASDADTLPPEPSDGCLDEDAVVHLLSGSLQPEERSRITAHLDACPACLELVGRVAARAPSDPLADTVDSGPGRPTPGPRSAAAQRERGDVLGRYVILSVLGHGGMGLVYAAYDPELDRKVALKLLLPRGGADDISARLRLQREAQSMARLAHPNVLVVHDVGTVGDQVFIAMEFVDGATLGAWQRRDRPWREVLAAFVSAGRGLEAAHRAGIVHRDFKPDNVLVDRAGRVRVMDFGLAAPAADSQLDTQEDDGSPDQTEIRPAQTALDVRLTSTGTLLGTPLYMAPEQHLGHATDARTDQFSFCVALYDALFRARPFEGNSIAALAVAVTSGRTRTPPKSAVPARIRRAIMRGLSVCAEDRFASMGDLLAELQVVRRRRRGLAVGVTAIVGLAGVGVGSAAFDAQPCAQVDAAIDQVWNEARADAVTSALVATGASHAAATAGRVGEEIDGYVARWRAMRTDVCEATHVRQDQSGALLDLRMACLDRRAAELNAAIEVLETADREVVDNAVAVAGAASEVAQCAEVQRLQTVTPLPADVEQRAQIMAVEATLAAVRANHNAGRLAAAVESGTAALVEAKTTDYAPLIAEAAIDVATAQVESLAVEDADANLRVAISAAARGGTDEIAARAWIQKLHLLATGNGDPEQGLAWAFAADAAVRRVERSVHAPVLRAALLDVQGILHAEKGDLPAAEALHRQAIALVETEVGRDELRLYSMLHNLGAARAEQGDAAEASAVFRRGVELLESNLGVGHPSIAYATLALAQAERDGGNRTEALALFERWLPEYEKAAGKDHATLAVPLFNYADLLAQVGDVDRALDAHTRALAIREATLGPDHPKVALSLIGLAGALLDRGRYADALPELDRALAILNDAPAAPLNLKSAAYEYIGHAREALREYDAALSAHRKALALLGGGDAPQHMSTNHGAIAHILVKQGHPRRALEAAEEALRVLEPIGLDNPTAAEAFRLISRCSRDLHDYARAQEALERALSIYEAIVSPNSPDLAWVRFDLAQLLWRRGEHAQARAYAQSARASLALHPAHDPTNLTEIDGWLQETR